MSDSSIPIGTPKSSIIDQGIAIMGDHLETLGEAGIGLDMVAA